MHIWRFIFENLIMCFFFNSDCYSVNLNNIRRITKVFGPAAYPPSENNMVIGRRNNVSRINGRGGCRNEMVRVQRVSQKFYLYEKYEFYGYRLFNALHCPRRSHCTFSVGTFTERTCWLDVLTVFFRSALFISIITLQPIPMLYCQFCIVRTCRFSASELRRECCVL